MTKDRYERVLARMAHTEARVTQTLQEIVQWTTVAKIVGAVEFLPGKLGYELRATGLQQEKVTALGFTAGECFHNLRSILDNLCVSLAYLHADPPSAPKKLYWPIYLRESDFRKRALEILDQVSPQVALELERVQPFQRQGRQGEGWPSDDPGLLLHAIDVDDKHYTPLVVSLNVDEMTFGASAEFETDEGATLSMPPSVTITTPIREGEVFLRWDTNGPLAKAAGKFDVKAHLALSFGPSQLPLNQALTSLTTYVRLVVNHFGPFFR